MVNSLPLLGCLVLVVEEDPIIGLDVVMTLKTAGAEILGPCHSAKSALNALEAAVNEREPQCAVLDVNLGGHTSEAVAKELKKLSIPFVLHTGYFPIKGQVLIGIEAPIVRKPSDPEYLLECVVGCISRRC